MFFVLKKMCAGGIVKRNVMLKTLSTIKIGGKAKFVVYPICAEQVFDLVNFFVSKNIAFYVVGCGSNILFSDSGFKGVIICLKQINEIRQYNNYLQVGAGAQLSRVVKYANEHGLKGLEDAMGIPGTVGGAVVMNAGAYNYETKNVVAGVLVLRNGKIQYLGNDACEFGYRKSCFKKGDVIISVDIKLEPGNSQELSLRSYNVLKKRINLPKAPSLGSVFKRQNNIIVSKLIDEMGLKGLRVGDAMVSFEHAGFIINVGQATEKDVKELIKIIKNKCWQEKQIELVEEIRYL